MALKQEGPAIGGQFIEVDHAESTNKLAAELIELSKVQHGAVILAREQTMGRGQQGRSWNSQPGLDLTFSVVLRPTALRVEDQFGLSKMAALAVYDVVCSIAPDEVRIKWPNDVLIGRRKVAGILIKNEVVGELVLGSIVGVGLNVNSRSFPESLMATSLSLASGQELDLDGLMERVVHRFEQRWSQFTAQEPLFAKEYSALLWSKGRWAPVTLDGAVVNVRPMDVDLLGRLLVEHEDGRVMAYGMDRLRFAPR